MSGIRSHERRGVVRRPRRGPVRPVATPVGAVVLAVALVACTGSDPTGTEERSPARADTAAPTSTTRPPTDGECRNPAEAPLDGPSTTVETIGEADGVEVAAAVYPLPDTEGDPWSQWGQGVVLPDGRFVSAVGDHRGRDGTSWFYEYDPERGELTRTAEVSEALGHQPGDWGYGKVHAPMHLGPCDEVITASYWGTRRDLVGGGSYSGDHLLRYDPATHEITSLGVPVEGFGIPSIAVSPDRRWIFGEAVDPANDTGADTGAFFVADATTGEVVHRSDDPDHIGFRTILVTAPGEALYAAEGSDLFGYSPGDESPHRLEDALPGGWLRSSSPIAPDGSVYGATQPGTLFRVDADGEITNVSPTDTYIASLGLSPDGSTLYYVPDAHGGAWAHGAPLVAVDTATGDERVVVELNGALEEAFDLRAGGSYNVVADPGGERVYIGMNAGPADPGGEGEADAFGAPVLFVVDLP